MVKCQGTGFDLWCISITAKARCRVEFSRHPITSGSGGRDGYYRKALTTCLFITAAVSPERKNENINYDVPEPSQIFRTQAKISSLVFTPAAVISLIIKARVTRLKLSMQKGSRGPRPAAADDAIQKRGVSC